MRTSILSIMLTALFLTFGWAAQAKSAGYVVASEYINAGKRDHSGKGHKSKKHGPKKTASHKKSGRSIASEKKHKKSKSKAKKKSKKRHH